MNTSHERSGLFRTRADFNDVCDAYVLRLRGDPRLRGAARDHRAQSGACRAVAGARVLHRGRIWLLLQAEFLAIALVLVYVGAVMVLFLFVVMMLDINLERLRAGFWSYLPLGAAVGVLMAVRDGAGARSADASGGACAVSARCGRLQQHQGARAAALHRLCLSVRDRRGDPAGGDRRGDRADHAQPQGSQAPGSRRAGRGQACGPGAHREDAVGEAVG